MKRVSSSFFADEHFKKTHESHAYSSFTQALSNKKKIHFKKFSF